MAGIASTAGSTSLNAPQKSDSLGDPDCPHCGGSGYVRPELPVGHPDFGRLEICVCRRARLAEGVRARLYALSRLDQLQGLTFDNFQARGRKALPELQANSLESARNTARNYAQRLSGWLLLSGGFGCGKTHLAAAIANFAVSMGVPTLFLTVPDLLDTLRMAYDSTDTTFEDRFEEVRSARLLVMDDFGTQNATPWAQEKLFQIINFRYINKLPTVITTNLGLGEIEPRIRSRLSDPELVTVVRITAPDFRRPTQDLRQPELSSLDLLAGKSFSNFQDRRREGLTADQTRSLQDALKAAHDFAEKPAGWLILSGPYGSGKTHLAAAIANYRAALGDPSLFVVVPDLLDHLRATFSPDSKASYDRRFEEVRSASLLVLDDLGSQSATPWAREKLHQLLNHRYNAQSPTVVTVARESMAGEEIDQRIVLRMQDARISRWVAITAPAYQSSQRKKTAKS